MFLAIHNPIVFVVLTVTVDFLPKFILKLKLVFTMDSLLFSYLNIKQNTSIIPFFTTVSKTSKKPKRVKITKK